MKWISSVYEGCVAGDNTCINKYNNAADAGVFTCITKYNKGHLVVSVGMKIPL